MSMRRGLGIALAFLLVPVAGAAQTSFGPQLSWGTDSDIGVGARLFSPLRAAVPLTFTGSADYFFGDEPRGVDISWVEANAALVVPATLAPAFVPYLGGGLNLAFISTDVEEDPALDGSDVKVGLTLLGGWRSEARYSPFVEVRAVVGGASQLVFTAGLLLGQSR